MVSPLEKVNFYIFKIPGKSECIPEFPRQVSIIPAKVRGSPLLNLKKYVGGGQIALCFGEEKNLSCNIIVVMKYEDMVAWNHLETTQKIHQEALRTSLNQGDV